MKTRDRTKRESLLKRIWKLNPDARRDFLENFSDKELMYYLRELRGLDVQELEFCY